jgi:Tfp pilus assembly protein PilZ
MVADPRNQRLRSRVRMELPIRIRQIGPPRDSVEISHTLDVSRNGILFRTNEPYELNRNVWVTMPYQPNAPNQDPEFPGSVVRVARQADGTAEIAVQFHSSRADLCKPVYGQSPGPQTVTERRMKNRVRMTIPIRVRHQSSAEESVTLDVSRAGVLFQSNRPYPVGQTVWVMMPYQPGAQNDEVAARVVRIIDRASVRGVALQFSGHNPTPDSYFGS